MIYYLLINLSNCPGNLLSLSYANSMDEPNMQPPKAPNEKMPLNFYEYKYSYTNESINQTLNIHQQIRSSFLSKKN